MSKTSYVGHPPALQRRFREAGFWNDDLLTDYLERWARETPDSRPCSCPAAPP